MFIECLVTATPSVTIWCFISSWINGIKNHVILHKNWISDVMSSLNKMIRRVFLGVEPE
uniref:Uncharacterized protein n=1 Tax=Rhizophora mucronata TaxID=61149 RepID=A0A2P2P132_RHIMU